MPLKEMVEEAADYIRERLDTKARTGLILGSGLGVLREDLEGTKGLEYRLIPHFQRSTSLGHQGQLISGFLGETQVLVMDGRFHYYEGYTLQQVTLPIRVMALLGIKQLIITNAAGGINLQFSVGDLMFITDHINLLGENPLRGINYEEWGLRFPDMSKAYPEDLIEVGEEEAKRQGILTRRGVYAVVSGPSYETPAEIRYLRAVGADAVGMSTAPEVIVANHMGIKVLGISCITNMAAGVLPKPLHHQEVLETGARVKPQFIALLKGIVKHDRW